MLIININVNNKIDVNVQTQSVPDEGTFFCFIGLGGQKTLFNNVYFNLYLENLTRVVFDVI